MTTTTDLQRCLLIMNYNVSQTLKENIIHILKEQSYIPNNSGGYTLKMEPVSAIFNPIPAYDIFPNTEKYSLPNELDKYYNSKTGKTPNKCQKYGGTIPCLDKKVIQKVVDDAENKRIEKEKKRIEKEKKLLNPGIKPAERSSTEVKYQPASGHKPTTPADWDSHDVLSFIEITTGILGLIPTPASPFLLTISAVAGMTDAAVYYFKDDDPYSAAIYFALSIVPAIELIKVLRKNPSFKYSIEETKSILQRYKSGKLPKNETHKVDEIYKTFNETAHDVNVLTRKSVAEKLLKDVGKRTPKEIFKFYKFLESIGVVNLSKIVLEILGIPIAADLLYVWINRDLLDDKQNILIRENNELLTIWKFLKLKYTKGYTDDEIAQILHESQEKAAIEYFQSLKVPDLTNPIKDIGTPEQRKREFDKILQKYINN